MAAGIDAWQICPDGVQSIGHRVQQGDKDWSSFTIRSARDSGAVTEYHKRQKAIEGDWAYPTLTIQAFAKTKTGPLLSVGVAKTADIIGYIAGHPNEVVERRTSNAKFKVVFWVAMRRAGYKVVVVRPEVQQICKPPTPPTPPTPTPHQAELFPAQFSG